MSDPRAQVMLTQTGAFRAIPIAWTLEEPSNKPDPKTGIPSMSQPIAIQFMVVQKWEKDSNNVDGAWSETWPEGYFVYGRFYIIGKNGTLNQSAVEQLIGSGLWGGELEEVLGPPRDVVAIIEVGENTFDGKTTGVRVNWVQVNADAPAERSGFKPTNPSLLAMTRQKFQSQIRALAGGSKGGTPPAPPAMQPPIAAPGRQNGPATSMHPPQPVPSQPVPRVAQATPHVPHAQVQRPLPPPAPRTAPQAPRAPQMSPAIVTQPAPAAPTAPAGASEDFNPVVDDGGDRVPWEQ